ncbi:MAG: quinone oxidoreductase family protein [Gulosibacter sp.]|uniref:quinone oxidoreductase family protein n=1 Tax=Gulosibacter sp. TaxID=2817531 RepID=UPI003F8EDDA7
MTNEAVDQRWVATKFDGLDALEMQPVEVPPPAPGEVTIKVKAAGVNPIDLKMLGRLGNDPSKLPWPIGFEIAGIVTAIGQDAQPAAGEVEVGDEVVAFRIPGGYSTRVNVPAKDVLPKPPTVSFDEAAGLLLVGTTAAEMLHRVNAQAGDTILLHGASGALGSLVLQLAARIGARVVGTTSERNAENVSRYGAIPVVYGEGLADRVREAAPDGIDIALDAAGTEEALAASLELVADRQRILTVVRRDKAEELGIVYIGGGLPASTEFRDNARGELLDLAGAGEIRVPVSHHFKLAEAKFALDLVVNGSAAGKVVLRP